MLVYDYENQFEVDIKPFGYHCIICLLLMRDQQYFELHISVAVFASVNIQYKYSAIMFICLNTFGKKSA